MLIHFGDMAIGKETFIMTSKICVAGCSFSDYTKVDKVYGEYLAEKLGYDYLHEGAGCGSNWRIWRQVYKNIRDQHLTPNDILIVQYTITERQEFYSRFDLEHKVDDKQHLREKFGDGNIIRYKTDAYTWQNNKEEQKFMELYQLNHADPDFAELQFECHHTMFQNYLLANNIRTIFFKSRYRPELDLIHKFRSMAFRSTDSSLPPYNLSKNDDAHMNDLGHKNLADQLFKHIQEKVL